MPVAPRAPGRWQLATVSAIKAQTPSVTSFRLALPMWMPHIPGQHYDVRLTAPDGYTAQRSYSIASSPLDEGEIELTIDCLADGEVSPYFHDVVEVGDEVEVRGPFASYFVWRGDEPGPVVLVGGGSGVVPLIAMLRHRRRALPGAQMRLVYSVRNAEDVIYADELGEDAVLTFTREPPAGWAGHTGRLDAGLLADAAAGAMTAYVCGSNGFVESATGLLLEAGIDPARIRTERFGPTG
ncbi:MAG TPA: FAD-binding oxidoreductase [Solirubrobacteraceae bacterium]|nr:FAD-binding oxidoreductase [Solirubrobacteraceae bacterium]